MHSDQLCIVFSLLRPKEMGRGCSKPKCLKAVAAKPSEEGRHGRLSLMLMGPESCLPERDCFGGTCPLNVSLQILSGCPAPSTVCNITMTLLIIATVLLVHLYVAQCKSCVSFSQ